MITKNDRNCDDDFNTTSKKSCNKKESITSIINQGTKQKLLDKLEQAESTMELE